jgi:hypothetical protein
LLIGFLKVFKLFTCQLALRLAGTYLLLNRACSQVFSLFLALSATLLKSELEWG